MSMGFLACVHIRFDCYKMRLGDVVDCGKESSKLFLQSTSQIPHLLLDQVHHPILHLLILVS